MKLENETRKLIKRDKRSPTAIGKATGIGWRWIYRFKLDESDDYGIRRVQTLHDFLARQ